MTNKIFYMIGVITDGYMRQLGFRLINKLTLEIFEARLGDNRLAMVENLEFNGIEWKSNAGVLDKYSIIDIEHCRLIKSSVVVISQGLYYTLVDANGEIVNLNRQEFIALIKVYGIERFANIKYAPEGKKEAYVGCIRTPSNLIIDPDFKKLDYSSQVDVILKNIKARGMCEQLLSRFGISYDYTKMITAKSNYYILNELLKNAANKDLILFIISRLSYQDVYDMDIVGKAFETNEITRIELSMYTIDGALYHVEDDKQKEYKILYGSILSGNRVIDCDNLPYFESIKFMSNSDGEISIAGVTGGFGLKKPINMLFKLEDDKRLRYITYKYSKSSSIKPTSASNYEKATRIVGLSFCDKWHKLMVDKYSDKAVLKLIDIHEKVYGYKDYGNIGVGGNNKKIIDFDKSELEYRSLKVSEFIDLFTILKARNEDNIKLDDKWTQVYIIPLNRYEWVKVYKLTGNVRFSRHSGEVWDTSKISKEYKEKFIIQFISEGEIKHQYLWFGFIYTNLSDINSFLDFTVDKLFKISDNIVDATDYNGVKNELYDGLNNVGHKFTIMSNRLFNKYNPFEEPAQLAYFRADKTSDTSKVVSAAWDYGVSIVDGGYYIYLKTSYEDLLTNQDITLAGLLSGDYHSSSVAAIPIIKFESYTHMLNFFSEYIIKSANNIKFVSSTTAIKIAKSIILGSDEEINTSNIIQQIYEHIMHGKMLDKESMEKWLGMSLDRAGILI